MVHSQRGSERGSHPHTGECAAGAGTQRDHEAAEGAFGEQTVRGVPASEEEVLGTSSVGTGVFLCDGGSDDGGDDQAVLGVSL